MGSCPPSPHPPLETSTDVLIVILVDIERLRFTYQEYKYEEDGTVRGASRSMGTRWSRYGYGCVG